MATPLLMPKATAVWLVDNTALTFDQIAAFCSLHPLEVQGIADGDVAGGIMGANPINNGQLSREEIAKAEADPNYRMKVSEPKVRVAQAKRKGPRYTPISRRNERPGAIKWLVRNHPELKDAQIMRLVGTTKTTIDAVREGTHWNTANLTAMDPVTLGLCSQIDLDMEVKKAARGAGTTPDEAEQGTMLLSAEEALASSRQPEATEGLDEAAADREHTPVDEEYDVEFGLLQAQVPQGTGRRRIDLSGLNYRNGRHRQMSAVFLWPVRACWFLHGLQISARRCVAMLFGPISDRLLLITGQTDLMENNVLLAIFVLLAATVALVPLAKALGFGTILGYLVAGVLIGPYGIRLISDTASVQSVSEFGIVMMLFLIGLEVQPLELWRMRNKLMGLGLTQLIGTAALVGVFAYLVGLSGQASIVVGLALAMSSTAIALQSITSRGIMQTDTGRGSLAVLLLQDVAVIPILALIPLLARQKAPTGEELVAHANWFATLQIIVAFGFTIFAGRYLVRPILRFVAKTGVREAFTALGLAMVVGAALIMRMDWLFPGARSFHGRRVAGRQRIPTRTRKRTRTVQGLASGPVLHLGRHLDHLLDRMGSTPDDRRHGPGACDAQGRYTVPAHQGLPHAPGRPAADGLHAQPVR